MGGTHHTEDDHVMLMNHPHSRSWRLVAAAGILLLPLAARADGEPEAGRPAPRTDETAEAIQAPVGPVTFEPENVDGALPSLESVTIPADALHRGGVMTDGSLNIGAVTGLTASERTKLDLARAAVEASRAAGTLHVTELPEDTIPATAEELASMKLQQLEARQPVPLVADPIAGVGVDLPSVQEIGPSGLNAVEQAKLRGETIPPMPIRDAAPEASATNGDGAADSAPADPTPASTKPETTKEASSND